MGLTKSTSPYGHTLQSRAVSVTVLLQYYKCTT